MDATENTTFTGKGIDFLVPHEEMPAYVQKLRDYYDFKPGAPIYHTEFGYYCMEEWYEQGLSKTADLGEATLLDPEATIRIRGLNGCQAEFFPFFEEKVLEDRGEHELIQDIYGRSVLFFKGKRKGFMPEYLDHPVKDMKTWQEKCKWRMDPDSPERYENIESDMQEILPGIRQGHIVSQTIVGGYMYLRSLLGPEDLLYAFYDMPEVLHDCMESWLKLADGVTARHQQFITYDEILFDEDICYNHGLLCSPDMIKEFLFPYYQQLLTNIKSRQKDKNRKLHVYVGSDGNCEDMIQLYADHIGMDRLAPMEVASGCDVVKIGKEHPWLLIGGGIDKRVLAKGKDAIDEMLERIIPPMRQRGGYIPTCDHGVPAEVSLENYMHYRKRIVELGG